MKVLLVNPPRYVWPFMNEQDNFLLPQSLPCLAAVLRENEINVKIIDCMPLKMGWKSLEKSIQKESPDAIGVGTSESLFSNESLRALELAKKIDSEIFTIVGGGHFSHLIDETLRNQFVDFAVIGEGEHTLTELAKELEKPRSNFKKIKGIAFRKERKIIRTGPRPLIENLDDLPLPAYDLMPMDKYGKSSYLFHPGGTTIHHSRGCIGSCDFCSCWIQMAENKNGKLLPRWRTKSVARTIEEVELLYTKYKKKGLVFTDDTFNVDPKWNEKFADELTERDLDMNWFAFMRSDFIVRDDSLGIMKKMVDSGLSQVCIGVERAFDKDLHLLNKSYSSEITKKCFKILKDKYPQVFREATFIVGLRDDNRQTMLEQLDFAKEIDADYPAFHPVTPVPGTVLWERAKKENWLEIDDFRAFDWLTPVVSTKYLKREEIEDLLIDMNKKYMTITRLLRGLASRHKYKRKMYIWFLLVTSKMIFDMAKYYLNPLRKEGNDEVGFMKLLKPKWYDS